MYYSRTYEAEIQALVTHLAGPAQENHSWDRWRISRVGASGNNLIYRVWGHGVDLAVKWTIRDERDRAGREYVALHALTIAVPGAAPQPVLLDRFSFAQPVVVQTWLDGAPQSEPPADDAGWTGLLEHLARVHEIKPGLPIAGIARTAVLDMRSVAEGLAHIRAQLALIDPVARPRELPGLIARAARRAWPDLPAPQPGLCRGDPNILNFIKRANGWASVDWEYSGWGDPAFEIADLLCHPSYEQIGAVRRAWIVQSYCARRNDAALAARVAVYCRLMLVWWTVRFARYLHDIPRGRDPRLVAQRADWQADMSAKYNRYLERAESLLNAPLDCW